MKEKLPRNVPPEIEETDNVPGEITIKIEDKNRIKLKKKQCSSP